MCAAGLLPVPRRRSGNPAEQVPLPKPGPPIPRAYTREQAERLLAAILAEAKRAAARGDLAGQLVALRDYTWTALMYFTGLRQGEVRRLRRGDLELNRHAIKVDGKGGKRRTLTLPPVLVGILRRYLTQVRPGLGPRDHVFAELADDANELADPAARWRIHGANTNLNRLRATKVVALAAKEDAAFGLGPWTINNRLTKYGRLAGLDGAHGAHRWRHTHASLCLQGGMSSRTSPNASDTTSRRSAAASRVPTGTSRSRELSSMTWSRTPSPGARQPARPTLTAPAAHRLWPPRKPDPHPVTPRRRCPNEP